MHARSSITRKIEDEVRGVMRRDAQLQHAFRQSRRVGDMLLKDEEQEMQKVAGLADELLKREQRWVWFQGRSACCACVPRPPVFVQCSIAPLTCCLLMGQGTGQGASLLARASRLPAMLQVPSAGAQSIPHSL